MGPVPNNHSGQNVQEDMPLEGACPWPTVARFKNKPPWKYQRDQTSTYLTYLKGRVA